MYVCVYIPSMATGTKEEGICVYHVLELQVCRGGYYTRNIIFSDRLSFVLAYLRVENFLKAEKLRATD